MGLKWGKHHKSKNFTIFSRKFCKCIYQKNWNWKRRTVARCLFLLHAVTASALCSKYFRKNNRHNSNSWSLQEVSSSPNFIWIHRTSVKPFLSPRCIYLLPEVPSWFILFPRINLTILSFFRKYFNSWKHVSKLILLRQDLENSGKTSKRI